MKRFRLLVLALLLPVLTTAQLPPPARIGDTLPAFSFLNSEKPLTIVAFWASWCSSCIHRWPLLDSLQEIFADRLHIVLLNNVKQTGENKPGVEKFIFAYQGRHPCFSLPFVIEQSASIAALFPFMFIPHYVWIDANKRVVAITTSASINASNIRGLLDGSVLHLPEKTDRYSSPPQTN